MTEWDTNGDGRLSFAEAAAVTIMYVHEPNGYISGNIVSLKGIEYFTGLLELYCHNNKITSLDLSKNTVLEVLYCTTNALTSLDLSKNTALRSLKCDNNQLTSLDVSNNTALTDLQLYGNPGDGAGRFPVKVWPSFGTPPHYFTTDGWDYDGKTIVPVYRKAP